MNDATLKFGAPLASIIVPCKGRLHHLRRTLPNMLASKCDFAFEVIVVDLGCPQGTYEWCRKLDARGLVALKVLPAPDVFNHSRARNCGARIAAGRLLAFVDADVRLEPGWLREATRAIRAGRAGLATVGGGGAQGCQCIGTCAIVADVFHAVRGYDEAFRGYNGEDADLYRRAAARTRRAIFGGSLLTPIQHGNDERVRYQEEKDIQASIAHNDAYVARREEMVNLAGYGQGDFEIYRGQGDRLPPITWIKRKRIVRPFGVRRLVAALQNGPQPLALHSSSSQISGDKSSHSK